ncbi:hypothetical protein NKR23_g7088 [Pleurostoma richardsiae]|uniref:Uncharacterized protein n=1 Tax=Pleurostoma richardsiae TaxID=41990 RepID=A0AA38RMQ1_9PEZI|nr:hypothetical protein NKR23_g7088 [Pleurostoma richardsiae]
MPTSNLEAWGFRYGARAAELLANALSRDTCHRPSKARWMMKPWRAQYLVYTVRRMPQPSLSLPNARGDGGPLQTEKSSHSSPFTAAAAASCTVARLVTVSADSSSSPGPERCIPNNNVDYQFQ